MVNPWPICGKEVLRQQLNASIAEEEPEDAQPPPKPKRKPANKRAAKATAAAVDPAPPPPPERLPADHGLHVAEVQINRAPVLTLWVSEVAKRQG